ncbi:hypothetical protein Hsar01_03905 [Haloferula sargassicola]|uniref:Uncharacterized protein n=2 Tax=Haloferula sargassicola TaxID=490096 RepID=A0ABP9UTH2_9BACT
MKAILLFLVMGVMTVTPGAGLSVLYRIRGPEDCGDCVGFQARVSARQADFLTITVSVRPRDRNLSRDGLKAAGEIRAGSGGKSLALSRMESVARDGVFTFTFEVARTALPLAMISVSCQGGRDPSEVGEEYLLQLGGFAPAAAWATTEEDAVR